MLKRSDELQGRWREFCEQEHPHLLEEIRDMEHWSQSWSVTELLDGNDPDGIVEIVGDQASTYDTTEDEWSDLCCLFYDWWGCLNLGSSTPEWDEFWMKRLSEETEE